MSLHLAILNEVSGPEARVALVPAVISKILAQRPGSRVSVAAGAGVAAGYPDAAYTAAGAQVLPPAAMAKAGADLLFTLQLPTETKKLPLKAGGVVVGLNGPLNPAAALVKAGFTVLALEQLPRTSRAQAADVLSSQANLAGYAAALAVAQLSPRLMPALTTAAGSSKPLPVVVLGVGVAGLQAIATARRLGAAVSAFDLRPEVAEQIKSLGAKVIEIDGPTAEGKGGYAGALDAAGMATLQAKLAPFIAAAGGVISTAQVPGKPAPQLISPQAVAAMQPGSVIIDLAAGGYNAAMGVPGGNCPLTVANQVTQTENGVTLHGGTNWAATVAADASRFWAQNMANLLGFMLNAQHELVFTDDLIHAMRITEPTPK